MYRDGSSPFWELLTGGSSWLRGPTTFYRGTLLCSRLFLLIFYHSEKNTNLKNFIFGCAGSLLLRGLSLVAASRGSSLAVALGPLWQWLLLLQSTGSGCLGFSSCSSGLSSYGFRALELAVRSRGTQT